MGYLNNLYKRTMEKAYSLAYQEINNALESGGDCLDCGAYNGYHRKFLNIQKEQYCGIEWNKEIAESNPLIQQHDLNCGIPFVKKFRCVFAISTLEHLLNPVYFLNECYRVLEKKGSLVLLTPNISTYFTAYQVLMGQMPSTAPHIDSGNNTPILRHLVAWSFKRLIKELKYIGFDDVKGRGFGLYPFPNFTQSILEKIDPYHCHQMVITAKAKGE